MYNLFAIFPNHAVGRIPITRESQSALSVLISTQVAELLHEDRERHPYAPNFTPTDGGIVELEFSLPDALSQLSPSIPNGIPRLSLSDGQTLQAKAVVAVDPANGRYAFQGLDRRKIIGPRRAVLLFGAGSNELITTDGIVLGERLDAFYEDGTLFFTSETVVRRFLDMDAVFREATDEEIVEVLGSSKFADFDQAAILDPTIADTWVRKKVMFIKKTQVLNVQTQMLKQAALECKVNLVWKSNKMQVPSTKKELKVLLKFLSEDFLESPIRRKTIFEVSGKRQRR